MDTAPVARIPVICDDCGATGLAGEGEFSHLGDLLEFTPAPRQNKRQDGWTPTLQRFFIAKLAETASPTLAAEALGKNRYGAKKVYKTAGADSFRAAWDRAVAIGEGRIAAEIVAANAELAGLKPPARDLRRKTPTPPFGEEDCEDAWDDSDSVDLGDGLVMPRLMEELFGKYLLKVQAERNARMEGRIAEADFCLRQLSFFEVAIDIGDDDGLYAALQSLRRDGVAHGDIAETDASRFLGCIRRAVWEDEEGEPERPALPAPHLLKDEGTFRTEPLHHNGPYNHPAEGYGAEQWAELDLGQRKQAYEEQFARAAEQQIRWERRAIAAHAAHRSRSANDA